MRCVNDRQLLYELKIINSAQATCRYKLLQVQSSDHKLKGAEILIK